MMPPYATIDHILQLWVDEKSPFKFWVQIEWNGNIF